MGSGRRRSVLPHPPASMALEEDSRLAGSGEVGSLTLSSGAMVSHWVTLGASWPSQEDAVPQALWRQALSGAMGPGCCSFDGLQSHIGVGETACQTGNDSVGQLSRGCHTGTVRR